MAKASPHRRSVYVVGGLRTPFLKALGRPNPFPAADLGVHAARQLFGRYAIEPTDINEVIVGCVMPQASEANIARIIALRLGCGFKVPAWTVQRNCASGLQALDSASINIFNGISKLVLAGGVEAMSYAPLILKPQLSGAIADFRLARSFGARWQAIKRLRLKDLPPDIALIQGLTDPVVSLSMGQTAEILAKKFNISRNAMDEFAIESHQRLAKAVDAGSFAEIVPIYDAAGHVFDADNGLRRDTSMEKLAKLAPIFDKRFGQVTAGNSSQVTDGGAFLILADSDMIKRYQLPVIARIVDVEWAGVNPAEMGLGPAHAIAQLLNRQKLKIDEIDYWEINEAFAAQVLAVLQALDDKHYCHEHLGLSRAMGAIDRARLNVDGGAIAMGHPVGASGARIVLHLLNILERNNAKLGVASLCIGGGQGGAMLIERVTEVEE